MSDLRSETSTRRAAPADTGPARDPSEGSAEGSAASAAEAEPPEVGETRPEPSQVEEPQLQAPRVEAPAPPGPWPGRLPGQRLLLGGLGVVLLVVAVAGLVLGRDRDDGTDRAPAAPPPKPLKVTVAPSSGAAEVRPDATVRVVAANGRLSRVQVAAPGRAPVAGRLAAGGQSWESTGPLLPGIGYQVTWTARDEAGKQASQTTSFTTLRAKGELRAAVAPLEGETVGVGQPIVVYFNHPVHNKVAVERALRVEASREVVGAWRWFGDEQVRYRPTEYWPAHTRVRLEADLAGVDAGGGVWGVQSRGIAFTVGRSHVSTVNAATHQMTVEVDGQVARRMPVSTGRPEHATRNGVHTVLTKERVRIMDSDTVGLPGEYRVRAEYAVRLTNSGEFVHSAPWSVGAQGSANVSHGCVNLSPENAAWFFGISQRGDVVEVVGSTRGPTDTEGMLEWNMSFEEWRQGSALLTSPGTTDLS